MSNQTGWILIDKASGYKPTGYAVPLKRIDIRTGRWSADSIVDQTRVILNKVITTATVRGNVDDADYMAELLLDQDIDGNKIASTFGLTNTDRPIVIVDFLRKKVIFWQEFDNTFLTEVGIDEFVMNPDISKGIKEAYYSDN